MRLFLPPALLVALVFLGATTTPRARANEKDALAIVERAIKAQGGSAALTRAAQCKRTDTGTQAILTRDVPFVSKVTRSLPDRVRLQIELDKKITTTLVMDGNRGWQAEGESPSVQLPLARVREMREEAYVWWLTTLVPLTKSGFTLSTLERTRIDGEPAVGIRVVSKGHPDSRLYFLERNGLLAKIERRVTEAGREIDKEYLYSSYKEFDGVYLPTREIIKVNREKFTELIISNYTFPEKLGAGAFARP
ncbi:MAG: hypothetical protein U0840_29360 [Gemmataceae bacterium]